MRPLHGGVAFFGSLQDAYRACLWLRSASRVLLVIDRFEASNAEALYAGMRAVDWSAYLTPDSTFAIHARGTNDELKNTQFTALKAKDALCDYFIERDGVRPNVQQKRPDVQLEVSLRKQKATVFLDLSGEPLHRRGYRQEGVQSEAPIKENLAAAILLKSGWGTQRANGGVFYDPLCGSGTFVIEAAMIAADMAPGIARDYWGFTAWRGHDQDIWDDLLVEADERLEHGLQDMPYLVGSDNDARVIDLAHDNAKRTGLADRVRFEIVDVSEMPNTITNALATYPDASSTTPEQGMIVTNPPYGERLMGKDDLPDLYYKIKLGLKGLPQSWSFHAITSDSLIDDALGMIPYEVEPLYNGKIEATLHHYQLKEDTTATIDINSPLDGSTISIAVLEQTTEQFAARLKKMAKERRKWAKRENISCYRVYDADLPDYAVSIDHFEGTQNGQTKSYVNVTEYRAPKEIDERKAKRRYQDIIKVVPAILGASDDSVISKVRKREKGGFQYGSTGDDAVKLLVKEGGHTFELDLSSYLDTGLFLDHRITRGLVECSARNKRFLNLFAYTGTATVYAAGGGAATTTTVDLSNTYLDWARNNMRLNGFEGASHQFVRADVLNWLKDQQKNTDRYDLIFVDPPTFSNSKKMEESSWSVQRDHVGLLSDVANLLAPGGTIIFSCNLRNFKPDADQLNDRGLTIKDITPETIPHDFERNKKIHHCYLITPRA